MTASAISFIRGFSRDSAGSAGIELGLGSVALLTVSMLCFDIYSMIRLDTAGARSAVAIADYVSRETAPNGDEIAALGEFLHRTEFDVPASVVYVISAVSRPAGADPAAVLWVDDTIRFGNEAAKTELAAECILDARSDPNHAPSALEQASIAADALVTVGPTIRAAAGWPGAAQAPSAGNPGDVARIAAVAEALQGDVRAISNRLIAGRMVRFIGRREEQEA